MLYYTEEARQSAVEEINRLVLVLRDRVPADILSTTDFLSIVHHLSDLKNVISRESRKCGK